MKKMVLTIAMGFSGMMAQAGVVGKVDTTTRMLGSNDAIVVESIKDPNIDGITCHISYAKTGGVSGSFGMAEDPSTFSIACRQTGPIVAKTDISKQAKVASFDKNIFFKTMIVERMFDKENNTIIYLVYSRKLIDGSPFNAISSIPLMPWGSIEAKIK